MLSFQPPLLLEANQRHHQICPWESRNDGSSITGPQGTGQGLDRGRKVESGTVLQLLYFLRLLQMNPPLASVCACCVYVCSCLSWLVRASQLAAVLPCVRLQGVRITHKLHACLAFSLGSHNPDSGLRARTASVSPTEPSPSPKTLFPLWHRTQDTCENGCVDRRETTCPCLSHQQWWVCLSMANEAMLIKCWLWSFYCNYILVTGNIFNWVFRTHLELTESI